MAYLPVFGNWQFKLDCFVNKSTPPLFQSHKSELSYFQYLQEHDNLLNDSSIRSYFSKVKQTCNTQKSDKESKSQREEGNKKFKRKEYLNACVAYSQGLLNAAHNAYQDTELSLCLANRSAALLHLGKYKECLADCEACMSFGYPFSLKHKVLLRRTRCLIASGRKHEAETVLCQIKELAVSLPDSAQQYIDKEMKTIESETTIYAPNCSSTSPSLPLLSNRHEVLDQASSHVRLAVNKQQGRHLLCEPRTTIRAGDLLMVEKPYAAVLLPDHYRTHCNHCYVPLENSYYFPCSQCCEVRYCSMDCAHSAWHAYHRFECPYQSLLHSIGIAHLSLRLVLTTKLSNLLAIYARLTEEDIKSSMDENPRNSPEDQDSNDINSVTLTDPAEPTRVHVMPSNIGYNNCTVAELSQSAEIEQNSSLINSETTFDELCNLNIHCSDSMQGSKSSSGSKAPKISQIAGVSDNGKYSCKYRAAHALMPHMDTLAPEDLYQYGLTACLLLKVLDESNFFLTENCTPGRLSALNVWQWEARKRSYTDSCGKNQASHKCNEDDRVVTQESTKLEFDTGRILQEVEEQTGCRVTTQDLTRKHDLEKVRAYVGSLLLRHVCQLVCNAHAITELRTVQATGESLVEDESQERIATAIYPTASLMNHSCEPNIIASFCGNTLVVKAATDIQFGDQIFNCYGPHYLRMRYEERQASLRSQYKFTCQCVACGRQSRDFLKHQALKCCECSGPALWDGERATYECSDCKHHSHVTAEVQARIDSATRLFNKATQLLHDKPDEAVRQLERVLREREGLLHRHHRDIGETHNALAKAHAHKGRWEDAWRHLSASLCVTERMYGADSVETAHELHTGAELLLHACRFAQSAATADRARLILQAHYSEAHARVQELRQLQLTAECAMYNQPQ